MQLVYGRGDFFSSLEFGGLREGRNSTDAEIVRQRHMLGMLQARSDMIQADAERTISLCLNRNLRGGTRILQRLANARYLRSKVNGEEVGERWVSFRRTLLSSEIIS